MIEWGNMTLAKQIKIVIILLVILFLVGIAWRTWDIRFGSGCETADWQTYRDEDYGFEMKYPAGWDYYLVESDDIVFPMYGDIVFAPQEVIDNLKENPHNFYGRSLTFIFRHYSKDDYENFIQPAYGADDEYGDVSIEDIVIDDIRGEGYITETLLDFLGFSKGDIVLNYVIPFGRHRYLDFSLLDYQQIDVFKEMIDSIELDYTTITKSGLFQLKTSIALCCAIPTRQLQIAAGSDICNPEIGGTLPEHSDFGLTDATDLNYIVTAQCDTYKPIMTVTIQNHHQEACNGTWTITDVEVKWPPDC